jgi:hypothetical protein
LSLPSTLYLRFILGLNWPWWTVSHTAQKLGIVSRCGLQSLPVSILESLQTNKHPVIDNTLFAGKPFASNIDIATLVKLYPPSG